MINHARTLLMNVAGSAPLAGVKGEEIVDPAFLRLELPTAIQTVRQVLFGTDPDRHMLNYRCRQLLALVEATPLLGYLLKLDRRQTYRFSTELVPDEAWDPVVTALAGAGTLSVTGDPAPSDGTGRVYYRHLLTVTGPGVVECETVVKPIQKVDLDFAAGTRFTLPLSGVKARLSVGGTGERYAVDVYSRPRKDLSELATAASNLGEPVYNYLFGITDAEPYRTFRNLWFNKQELPLRLGGLICALVYRTEEVRRGQS